MVHAGAKGEGWLFSGNWEGRGELFQMTTLYFLGNRYTLQLHYGQWQH